jgi:hypothetical protein
VAELMKNCTPVDRAQILIGGFGNSLALVIWTKHVVDRFNFTNFALHSGFTANFSMADVMWMIFAARPRLFTVLYETSKRAFNLNVHQDGGHPYAGIFEILDTEASIAEISMSYHRE